MTDVRPGKQARLANLLKTADTTADPGTSELSGFACARVATPTNWRHVLCCSAIYSAHRHWPMSVVLVYFLLPLVISSCLFAATIRALS